MKWLLTVPAVTDLAELGRALAAHGVTVDAGSRIPLDDGWAAAGAAVLLTAEEGAVWLRSDGQRVARVDWRR